MKKLIPLLLCAIVPLSASEKEKEKQPTPADVMKLTGMGSDVGAKAGMGAILLIGQGISSAATTAKGYVVAGAAYAKSAAITAAAAPAAPYVAGAVVVGGASYAGYKTYRYFVPDEEQMAKIAERERKLQADLEAAEIIKCRRNRSILSSNLTKCVYAHRMSKTLTQHGYPTECQDEAYKLSLEEGGDEEVIRVGKKHQMFTPSWERRGSK